jgi:hypothetical protein
MKAIFGTDLTPPLSDNVKRIRSQLSNIRGQISDIKHEYGWADRFETAEEGITLVISYLFHVLQEIEKVEDNQRTPINT